MKRIETPLQASILLDAFSCPITLTGNICTAGTITPMVAGNVCLFNQPSNTVRLFLSFLQKFPGYNQTHTDDTFTIDNNFKTAAK